MEDLNRIYINCTKAKHRQWSANLIKKYILDIDKIINREPNLCTNKNVLSIINFLENKAKLINNFEQTLSESEQTLSESDTIEMGTPHLPPLKGQFNTWLQMFENYAILTNMKPEHKHRFFLHLIGEEAATKIVNSVKPADPFEKSYNELTQIAKKIFEKSNLKNAYQLFFNLTQNGDTVQDYAEKLKQLGEEAGLSTENNEIFSNKFINGLNNDRIKFELLKEETKKDFAEVINTAIKLDDFINSQNNDVNKVQNYKNFKPKNDNEKKQNNKQNKNKKFEKNQCFFCKKYNHWKKDCFKYKKWLEKQTNEVETPDAVDNISFGNLKI